MSTFVTCLFFIAVGLTSLIIFGFYEKTLRKLLTYLYYRHKKIRRDQRPSRIFLVRHGESKANIDTTLYARVPDHQIELTQKGHEQALEAGKKLRSIIGNESAYVYMSPYTRSKQTWAGIRKSFSPLQIITEREDPRLREQEFGNIADLAVRPKEFEEQERVGHFFYRFSNGESGADVYDRASLFLDSLFRELDNGHHDPTQNIILVSHGLFMRLFLMRYLRWTVEQLYEFKLFDNCEICQLTKDDGVYILKGHARPPTQTS